MTAQSFSDRSSLGLAYVATIDEAGGICADPREVRGKQCCNWITGFMTKFDSLN